MKKNNELLIVWIKFINFSKIKTYFVCDFAKQALCIWVHLTCLCIKEGNTGVEVSSNLFLLLNLWDAREKGPNIIYKCEICFKISDQRNFYFFIAKLNMHPKACRIMELLQLYLYIGHDLKVKRESFCHIEIFCLEVTKYIM